MDSPEIIARLTHFCDLIRRYNTLDSDTLCFLQQLLEQIRNCTDNPVQLECTQQAYQDNIHFLETINDLEASMEPPIHLIHSSFTEKLNDKENAYIMRFWINKQFVPLIRYTTL